MKICFWFCCVLDSLFIFWFAYTLLSSYLSGVMAAKSLNDIVEFVLLLAGVVWLLISAVIFYNSGWLKTATALASIPFLALLFIFLIPVIAYISGERMN